MLIFFAPKHTTWHVRVIYLLENLPTRTSAHFTYCFHDNLLRVLIENSVLNKDYFETDHLTALEVHVLHSMPFGIKWSFEQVRSKIKSDGSKHASLHDRNFRSKQHIF